ncbi:hypothetical protein M5K25_008938 [Dendrobium thyrsiflorum]|uniref:Uncharacterized protein n=1 Tax=Dendrobium thyrsiflorum TaxID=117978 RepID=A0ABD0VAX5_DENTH
MIEGVRILQEEELIMSEGVLILKEEEGILKNAFIATLSHTFLIIAAFTIAFPQIVPIVAAFITKLKHLFPFFCELNDEDMSQRFRHAYHRQRRPMATIQSLNLKLNQDLSNFSSPILLLPLLSKDPST